MRARPPVLLAPRLRQVAGQIFGPDDDHLLLAADQQRGDVCPKRRVATLVIHRVPAVDPHRRPVVHGTEVHQQPLCRPQIRGEGPPVPDDRVHAPIPDPARGRLRRKGHLDLAQEHVRALHPALVQPHAVVVVRETPRP
jgi:hypothetical protein